jgi:hypothetical protein
MVVIPVRAREFEIGIERAAKIARVPATLLEYL